MIENSLDLFNPTRTEFVKKLVREAQNYTGPTKQQHEALVRIEVGLHRLHNSEATRKNDSLVNAILSLKEGRKTLEDANAEPFILNEVHKAIMILKEFVPEEDRPKVRDMMENGFPERWCIGDIIQMDMPDETTRRYGCTGINMRGDMAFFSLLHSESSDGSFNGYDYDRTIALKQGQEIAHTRIASLAE